MSIYNTPPNPGFDAAGQPDPTGPGTPHPHVEITPVEDLIGRALDEMLAQVEDAIVTHLENIEGRVPSTQDMVAHATAQWVQQPNGSTVCIFFWKNVPIVQYDFRIHYIARIPGENT